jgi:hypothetical protein
MTSLRMPARLAVTATISLVAVAALAGCSVLENIFPAQAQRDAETQEIAEAGEQDVFQVSVGDCFNDGTDESSEGVSAIAAVPCAEPHDNEIYYLFDIAGDEFPVDVDVQADNGCYDQFAAFVGLDYETSTIDYFPIYPAVETWETGDREVICSVFDSVQTTGTLAGAAR